MTSPITSVPMQKAIVIMTAHPVTVAVTKLETIANGTAFAALLASSAIVALLSNPDTTQTGVRKLIINAQPLFVQKPVLLKSVNTKLAEFLSSEGVPAARAMMRASSMANWMNMYDMLSLLRSPVGTHVMPNVRRVVATNMP